MNNFRSLLVTEVESRNALDNVRKSPQGLVQEEFSDAKALQNPVWRKLVVQWCYAIVDTVGADREVVYITFDLLDRFLALKSFDKRKFSDKRYYEASVISSLLMATRLLSNDHRLCMKDIVEQSAISVSSDDIRNTCKDIYKSLNWDKSSPSAHQFARTLVELLPTSIDGTTRANVLGSTMQQIESAVEDESCMRFPSSLIAWMALENALCKEEVPAKEKVALRTTVAKISGHSYSMHLRYRLCYKAALTKKRKVIEKENDDGTMGSALRRSKKVKYFHNLFFKSIDLA